MRLSIVPFNFVYSVCISSSLEHRSQSDSAQIKPCITQGTTRPSWPGDRPETTARRTQRAALRTVALSCTLQLLLLSKETHNLVNLSQDPSHGSPPNLTKTISSPRINHSATTSQPHLPRKMQCNLVRGTNCCQVTSAKRVLCPKTPQGDLFHLGYSPISRSGMFPFDSIISLLCDY